MSDLLSAAENVAAPWLGWLKLGVVLVAAGSVFAGGIWLEATIKDRTIADLQAADAKAQTVAVQLAMARIAKADIAGRVIADANARAHAFTAQFTVTLAMEIPRYVTPETDARFPLPCGFVRLYDASLAGVDPATISLPAGDADGSACPVKASDAASILAWNNGVLNDAIADNTSWWAWYDAQSAIWNAAQPTPTEK